MDAVSISERTFRFFGNYKGVSEAFAGPYVFLDFITAAGKQDKAKLHSLAEDSEPLSKSAAGDPDPVYGILCCLPALRLAGCALPVPGSDASMHGRLRNPGHNEKTKSAIFHLQDLSGNLHFVIGIVIYFQTVPHYLYLPVFCIVNAIHINYNKICEWRFDESKKTGIRGRYAFP